MHTNTNAQNYGYNCKRLPWIIHHQWYKIDPQQWSLKSTPRLNQTGQLRNQTTTVVIPSYSPFNRGSGVENICVHGFITHLEFLPFYEQADRLSGVHGSIQWWLRGLHLLAGLPRFWFLNPWGSGCVSVVSDCSFPFCAALILWGPEEPKQWSGIAVISMVCYFCHMGLCQY